jgi:hypothetical protein
MGFQITLPPQLRGEDALRLISSAESPDGGSIIFGEPLVEIDAWGVAAISAMIETYGRHHQRRVTFSLPSDERARSIIYGALRETCSQHLVHPQDTEHASEELPPCVLLEAGPLRSVEAATRKAERIFERGRAIGVPGRARFAAKHLPELVEEALAHTSAEQMPPVACSLYLEDTNVVQLVVIDPNEAPDIRGGKRLKETILDSGDEEAPLALMADHARRRSLPLEVSVAAGSGRLRCQGKSWTSVEGPNVQGFCIAIELPA